MNTIISLFLSWGLLVTPVPKYNAQITEIENDRAVVELTVDNGYRADIYVSDFPIKENDFEPHIQNPYIGKILTPTPLYGTFVSSHEALNYKMEPETLYLFETFDKTRFWFLSEADMGFIPEFGATYVIIYYDNVETEANHKCDPELHCDCFLNDDCLFAVICLY